MVNENAGRSVAESSRAMDKPVSTRGDSTSELEAQSTDNLDSPPKGMSGDLSLN